MAAVQEEHVEDLLSQAGHAGSKLGVDVRGRTDANPVPERLARHTRSHLDRGPKSADLRGSHPVYREQLGIGGTGEPTQTFEPLQQSVCEGNRRDPPYTGSKQQSQKLRVRENLGAPLAQALARKLYDDHASLVGTVGADQTG